MPNPQCTVNGLITTNGVDVAGSSSVTIQLADPAGSKQWSIQCISTDDESSAAAVNASITVNQITKTATFTAPAGSVGAALIFESVVNNQLDISGKVEPTFKTRFGIFILTSVGLRVAAFDETTEGSAAFGWTKKYNDGIRAHSSMSSSVSIGAVPLTIAKRNVDGELLATKFRGAALRATGGSTTVALESNDNRKGIEVGLSVDESQVQIGFFGTAPVPKAAPIDMSGSAEAKATAIAQALKEYGLLDLT